MNNSEDNKHFHPRESILSIRSLALYRGLLQEEIFDSFMELIRYLAQKDAEVKIVDTYSRFASLMIDWDLRFRSLGADISSALNPWQNYIIDFVLHDQNPFSRRAALAGTEGLSGALHSAASRDLNVLGRLAGTDPAVLRDAVRRASGMDDLVEIDALGPGRDIPFQEEYHRAAGPVFAGMRNRLASSCNWGQDVERLVRHYHLHGCGLLSRYYCLRWSGNKRQEDRVSGQKNSLLLEGIEYPDPVELSNLIGYKSQKEAIVGNTDKFVRGLPAHNMLLYGDRGTGKSSTIKAVGNMYRTEGLRLVEVPKEGLGDIRQVMNVLRGRPLRFILFVDDLSFDEGEVEYKELKAVLDGRVETQPENVLIYATSNRRHLIREYFSERERLASDGDEVHGRDTVEEKLSLADRFGISLVFTRPSRQEYLEIVAGLAEHQGLDVEKNELEERALQWERMHNIRSGRTARQFVDELSGELGIEED